MPTEDLLKQAITQRQIFFYTYDFRDFCFAFNEILFLPDSLLLLVH